MTEKKLMTLDQASKYLGVAKTTIYGWTSKRKVPFRKVGRILRFDKDELEEWSRRDEVTGFTGVFRRGRN
jgi:excisionase family DNA binding protein